MTTAQGAQTTAQVIFDGQYDLAWMKSEARYDFECSMQEIVHFHFEAMNFAVTVASLADWAWMLHARYTPAWASQKNPQNAFVGFIAHECNSVATLTDFANEYKHADRVHKNMSLRKLEVRTVKVEKLLTLPPGWEHNALAVANIGFRFIPIVETDCDRFFYKALGQAALAWWDNFDPSMAAPP